MVRGCTGSNRYGPTAECPVCSVFTANAGSQLRRLSTKMRRLDMDAVATAVTKTSGSVRGSGLPSQLTESRIGLSYPSGTRIGFAPKLQSRGGFRLSVVVQRKSSLCLSFCRTYGEWLPVWRRRECSEDASTVDRDRKVIVPRRIAPAINGKTDPYV